MRGYSIFIFYSSDTFRCVLLIEQLLLNDRSIKQFFTDDCIVINWNKPSYLKLVDERVKLFMFFLFLENIQILIFETAV